MTTQMKAALAKAAEQLEISEEFCIRYGDRVPDATSSFCCGNIHFPPSLLIFSTEIMELHPANLEAKRQAAIQNAGEVFGREDWKRNLQTNGVDWEKTVDGVKVTIRHAEPNEGRKAFEDVSPALFAGGAL